MPFSAATLLLRTFAAAERAAVVRKERGREYSKLLAGHPGRIEIPADADPGYLRFPLRVANADRTVRQLGRFGVARTFPQPLPRLPELRALLRKDEATRDWPGAAALVEQLVTLPTHGMVGRDEVARITEGVQDGRTSS
jgi:dTDP-4-amino-4,6-dideoxygalactose transaminase